MQSCGGHDVRPFGVTSSDSTAIAERPVGRAGEARPLNAALCVTLSVTVCSQQQSAKW